MYACKNENNSASISEGICPSRGMHIELPRVEVLSNTLVEMIEEMKYSSNCCSKSAVENGRNGQGRKCNRILCCLVGSRRRGRNLSHYPGSAISPTGKGMWNGKERAHILRGWWGSWWHILSQWTQHWRRLSKTGHVLKQFVMETASRTSLQQATGKQWKESSTLTGYGSFREGECR